MQQVNVTIWILSPHKDRKERGSYTYEKDQDSGKIGAHSHLKPNTRSGVIGKPETELAYLKLY